MGWERDLTPYTAAIDDLADGRVGAERHTFLEGVRAIVRRVNRLGDRRAAADVVEGLELAVEGMVKESADRLDGTAASGIGVHMIALERLRQIASEGFTYARDDGYTRGELASCAAGYCGADGPDSPKPGTWPWDACEWKPKDRVRNLVRAGALIAAEIDRLRRMEGGGS